MSGSDNLSTVSSPILSGHNVNNGTGGGQSVLSSGYGRGRPVCPVGVTRDHATDMSLFGMSGPTASSTPNAHVPYPIPPTSPRVVTTDVLDSVLTVFAREISDNITASLHTLHQASSSLPQPQPQPQSNQNVTIDPTHLKVIVQPESRPPPLFRGDQSESFSIHEWEDMMKSFMSRVTCSSDNERSELIMSRLAGRARDVVKVSLRSRPSVSPAQLPTMIFDILKRNFSELTFSNMPMKDFYGTVPSESETAMDYWIRLNKAIDVADECLCRRGKGVEDPSAEVVMMFICHCPDPSLAVSFQFKPAELWTAAEVQERLDGHVRSLRSTAARPQHAVNLSACTHITSTVPAPRYDMQYQPPDMISPQHVTHAPATACAPAPSQLQQPPVLVAQSSPSPAVPAADADIQQVATLFDKVLSLCTASLSNSVQAHHQSQNFSRQPRNYSRQPRSYSGMPQHSHPQPSSPCTVCGDSNHTTHSHCRLYRLCLHCHKPGHFRNACPLAFQPPDASARSPSDAALN